MKSLFFSLVFLALSFGAAFGQSDDAAIKVVIEAESKAFHTNDDRSAFIAFWHITPDSRMVYSGPGTSMMYSGADMQAAISAGKLPPANQAESVFSNYAIRASGNVAWATFDQKSTTPDGKSSTMHEFRMMEKVGGVWKIVSESVHEY